MFPVGERLCAVLGAAANEVVLVAPFIKESALRRVVEAIPQAVSLTVVTRWRPEEVRCGVTDLSVLEVVRERAGALWLRGDLHAKYFRADAHVLIGSANLTEKALGWSDVPNFELLEGLPVDAEWTKEFETALLNECVAASEEIRDLLLEAADRLPPLIVIDSPQGDLVKDRPHSRRPGGWVPSLRNPEELYIYYSSGGDDLSTASRSAAQADLSVLAVPPELSREAFERYVAFLLLQLPIVRKVDEFVSVERRFGSIRNLLRGALGTTSHDADRAWQTLMRWLLYFLPGRYSSDVPRHSELFVRVSGS